MEYIIETYYILPNISPYLKLDNIEIKLSLEEKDTTIISKSLKIYLNDINVEEEIRTMKVSNFVSKVSEIPEIRRQLVRQQQKMRNQGGIVMDGRDIGTVVFPDAHLKLFITASPEIRAKRRFKELIEGGEKVFFSDVLKNIVERDYLDSHREDSPLRKAKDAIEIDNSLLTLKEQYLKIRSIVKQTLIHLK